MAILAKHNFDKLEFYPGPNVTSEGDNVFYSGRQVGALNYGLSGQGPLREDHIAVSSDYSYIGSNSLKVTLEKPYYRDSNQILARSELRTQIYGGWTGSPGVQNGCFSFSWMTPQSSSSSGTSVIAQLWDGGSPSISIRWRYETNQLFFRQHNNSSNTDYTIVNANPFEWNHIDFWYQARENSSGVIKIRLNGTIIRTINAQNIFTPQKDSETPYWKLGQYNSSFGEQNNNIKICYFDAVVYSDGSDSEADTFASVDAFRGLAGPDYYVKNSGNDSNSGTSDSLAFQTLAKVNTLNLEPGDQIHLNGPSTFRESLLLSTEDDGISSDRIKIDSYGTGSSKITGAIPVDDWVSVSGNIYESINAGYPSVINGLIIGGVPVKKGRLPKVIDLEYQSANTTSLTSTSLPNVNYSGGEVQAVIEKNQWIHDTVYISGRSGNTITYSGGSSYSGGSNRKFFIQNAIECLTEQGDWMYSPSENKLLIYSETNPNSLNIEVSVRNYAIEGDGNAYTDYQNLIVEGANNVGIRIHVAGYARILNNTIRNQGNWGIAFLTASNGIIQNNLVEWCLNKGIDVYNESNNTLISRNTVRNIATIKGASQNGDGNGIGIRGLGTGITYDLNVIENIGYSGIYFRGNNTTITRNKIKNYCLLKTDGGALYCYGGNKDTSTYTNRVIHRNIISQDATPHEAIYGTYIDDNSENIEIIENLYINAGRAGYFNHNSHEILFNNNIVYGCQKAVMFAQNGDNELVRNNEVHNNVIVILSKINVVLSAYTEDNDIEDFATFSNNTYLVASNNQLVFNLRYISGGKRYFECLTFTQWQAMGFDLDSEVRYLNIPEYEILSESSDLLTGSVSAYLEGGSVNVSIDNTLFPGATKTTVTSAGTYTTRIEMYLGAVGAVDYDKDYILRFKAAASSGHQSLVIYVRETGAPYRRPSPDVFAYAFSEMQEFEFLFSNLTTTANASILVEHQSHQGDFYIQDFEFVEVSVDKANYEDHIKLVVNDTEDTDTIDIDPGWEDINGLPTEEVELESFESTLLLKTAEAATYEISATGDNVTITGTGTYTEGEEASLEATPNTGHEFVGWQEGEDAYEDNPYVFIVEGDRTFTAVTRKIKYTISVTVSNATVSGAGEIDYGDTASLQVTPSEGHEFKRWEENSEEISTDNPYEFTVEENRTLVAVVEKIKYIVSVDSPNGTVTGAGEIEYGEEASLEFISNTHLFVRWEEDNEEVSTDNPYVFEVTGNRDLTVVSQPKPDPDPDPDPEIEVLIPVNIKITIV